MGKTKPPKRHGDLTFSKRHFLLDKYSKTFSKEVYTKLWMNIWENELKEQINQELRILKIERILDED